MLDSQKYNTTYFLLFVGLSLQKSSPLCVILSGAQRSRTEAKRRRVSGISRGIFNNIVDPNASRCPP